VLLKPATVADKWAVQTWLDFLFSLLVTKEFWAAIFGAVVGGLFALAAQLFSNRAQRKLARDAEREAVKAIVRAFGIELEAFKHGFVDGLDPIFEQWKNQYKKAVPLNLPPTAQNYFAIYDGNAGALGRISDAHLSRIVLRTYSQAKSLIDAVNYNNERYKDWEPLTHVPGTAETQLLREDLIKWADETIRDRKDRLQKALPSLLNEIEKYAPS
jgi:hypothetical protein